MYVYADTSSRMEQEEECIVAGRAEEHSGSLLLTYFQGDINSMVDAHFSRALAKATKPKGDDTKNKKVRKSAKTGDVKTLKTLKTRNRFHMY